METKLRWGILSTGRIAATFARAVGTSQTGQVVAVGSRLQETADKFGAEFNIPHRHGNHEALLADPEVDAIYVSTPHPMHMEWTIKACAAGKNVLCEKPMGMNAKEVSAMFKAAKKAKVFLMEAFMYRCHPQTAKLVELLRGKTVGEVRVIESSFSYGGKFNPESRAFKNSLGGGGILDVGCYPVSMSRLIAGVALGREFADPLEVKGMAHLGQTGVDEYASALLKFEGDIVAEVSTGVTVNRERLTRVHGSEGSITLNNPWVCDRVNPDCPNIIVKLNSEKEPRTIPCPAPVTTFSLEADVFAAALRAGRAPHPAMSVADSLGNIKTLDRWRKSIGLVYEMEKRRPHGDLTNISSEAQA